MAKCYLDEVEVPEEVFWAEFRKELNESEPPCWFNKDGTLVCFGKANEYNEQSFHCAQLLYSGRCNDQVKGECWKRS